DAVVLMDDKEEDKKVEEAKEDETEPAKVKKVVDVVTTAKLITEVVTATSETVTTASAIIPTTEPQVPAATLTAALARVAVAPSRKRKGVVIRDPEEESTTSTIIPKTKSKDKGKGIFLKAKEDSAVKRYQAMKRKPQIEAQARKNMMMYLKNVVGFKLDYFKGMSYDDIQKAANRRKLNEEVEDLKRHLEIVPDEDDDVYTVATPLAKKERTWRHCRTWLKKDAHAQIKKNQRIVHGQAKVKSWKLLESCGVHIIIFTITQLILLVERRYPLSRFTLDQMLNAVRLQVEEESEVSLELLRSQDKIIKKASMNDG
nr:hypothetical protein [Tanacetum cinerariifolium]